MPFPSADSLAMYGETWSPAVAAWMVTCVVLGQILWRRHVARHRVAPSRHKVDWRHSDEYPALVILVAFGLTCGWQAFVVSATGDEASNIEPHFWSRWYLAWESRSSPPLFRLLIHVTEPLGHRIFMRLPSLAAALAALTLLYTMLRRRASAQGAQWLLGTVAASALLLGYAIEQKSYTLWLLLLLLCHRCIASALRGRRTMWAPFSLFASLALLTHYLSVAWLFGYVVWAWRESRDDLKDIILALLPGALAVLPMAVPILLLTDPVSEGPGASDRLDWLLQSATAALVPGGIIAAAALFLIRPIEPVRGNHAADSALPWIIATGTIATVLVAMGGGLAARFLMPVLPLSAIAAAARMPRPLHDWSRNDRLLLAGVALLTLITGIARLGPVAVAATTNPVSAALEQMRAQTPPTIRVVQPPWALHVAVFEASGRRDSLHLADRKGLLRRVVTIDGVPWGTLRKSISHEAFDAILREHGEFELWLLQDHSAGAHLRTIDTWPGGHCERTVSIGTADRVIPGPWVRVWRCKSAKKI